MNKHSRAALRWFCLGVMAALLGPGCSPRESAPSPRAEPSSDTGLPGAAAMEFCDFRGGPDQARVHVEAYYPGRHEDTIAALKRLLSAFPQGVSVEVVDWRRPAGLKRRDRAGLTCAGVTINGKNTFDLQIQGKRAKVLFVRGIDGEWTEEDLHAAVAQELALDTVE